MSRPDLKAINANKWLYCSNPCGATIMDCTAEIERLRGLLKVAKCPCCDGSGGYYDNHGNACQCQWCDEVKQALEDE